MLQESGRAGRDGQPARCVLFHRFADVLKQAAIVCMDHGWQRHLAAITAYASAARGCRRAMLASHFGEPPPPCSGACACDLCKAAAAAAAAGQQHGQQQGQQQEVDITVPALHALGALKVCVVGAAWGAHAFMQVCWTVCTCRVQQTRPACPPLAGRMRPTPGAQD